MFSKTVKITFVLLAILVSAAAAGAQGTITGCVTDTAGGKLPGVEVLAANEGARQKAITDATGCYEIKGLPAGDYTVTAALSGFVTCKREKVTVIDDQFTGPVDFVLCLGGLAEVLWVLPPGGLDGMWQAAAAVVHVRIVGTSPVRSPSPCPTNDIEHTAIVLEVLKPNSSIPAGETVTFVQESWDGERAQYQIEDEMIVFLTARGEGFGRLAGPMGVFLVQGSQIVSRNSSVNTDGMTPAEFLSKLRVLAKRQKAP